MRYTTLLALFFVAGVLALPTNESGNLADDQNVETDAAASNEAEEAQKISTPKKEFKKDVAMQADNPEPDLDLKTQTLKDGANTVQALISFDSSSLSEFRTTIGMERSNKSLYLSLSRSPNVNQLHLSLNGTEYPDLDSTRLDISNLDNGSSVYINLYYNSTAHGICASYKRLWEKENLTSVGDCVPVLTTQSGSKSKTQPGTGNMTAFYGYHGGVNQTNLYKATTGLFLDAKVSSAEDEDADNKPAVWNYLTFEGTTIFSDFSVSVNLQKGDSSATVSMSRMNNNKWIDVRLDDRDPVPLVLNDMTTAYCLVALRSNSSGLCVSYVSDANKASLECVQNWGNGSGPLKATYFNNQNVEVIVPDTIYADTLEVRLKVPDEKGRFDTYK
ncbi:hypothetical protein RI367_008796 [Sorochytrium milnesiophthora]